MQDRKVKDHPKAWSSIRSMFRRTSSVPGALTVDDLARAFQQERARTDRNGRPFCMVIFWAKDSPKYDLRPLAEHLRKKMRLYDLLGNLDGEHLAVLLPETPFEGAQKFAENALRDFVDESPLGAQEIATEICTYPIDNDAFGSHPGDVEGIQNRSEKETDKTAGNATNNEADSSSKQAEGPKDLSRAFLQPVSFWRRTIDILVAGTAILLLSPVYLIAAIAIKVSTPGPIIFAQLRAGRGGVPFKFYKFRSMYVDAEARKAALQDENEHDSGPIFKMKKDPRITPVGKVLRKSSIDELPQLFNVLKGDMTLIGPRPPTLDEVANYDLWQRKRLDLTGGITCIWQVSGRSEIKFDEWVRMDIEYQRRRSLWFDIKLLFKTIGAVVSGRGAY